MSSEHQTVAVRVKCINKLTCSSEHTAIIMKTGGYHNYIQCPKCGQMTKQKNLNILITYPKVFLP